MKLLLHIICMFIRTFTSYGQFSQNIELQNGYYFTGEKFIWKEKYYIEQGYFSNKAPAKVDTVIDLGGQYVVPPFGEAHTHMLSSNFEATQTVKKYLYEGIFYVQVLGNNTQEGQKLSAQFNKPNTVDVAYAHGGLTSTHGHPFMIFEPLAMGLFTREDILENRQAISKSRRMEKKSYWFFDTLSDVETKWPEYIQTNPDVVKIFLLNSERYDELKHDDKMGNKGLHPVIANEIVKRAHAVGKKVYAHIESIHDFRLALQIGVDGLAHIPNYSFECRTDTCQLQLQDLKRNKKSIAITPTLAASTHFVDSTEINALEVEQRRILQMLHVSNNKLLVGSDIYGQTALTEIQYWHKLKVLSNATLLKLWCETGKGIFPNRKIGSLNSGDEGSLLVLANNPILDFQAVTKISLRIKQGEIIEIRPVSIKK